MQLEGCGRSLERAFKGRHRSDFRTLWLVEALRRTIKEEAPRGTPLAWVAVGAGDRLMLIEG